uniref:Uncharacterized protein n=1 Tax=Felis catus TaxID=9685 RepID=A0ABI7ZE63_FELCA
MDECTILLKFKPKLASRSPVGSACSPPGGVSVRSFSWEASTWFWECLARKMCRVALASSWSSLEAGSSSPHSGFLFRTFAKDSGSRLSPLQSQTPGQGPADPAHAGTWTARGSASLPARGFPTATAEDCSAAEPPARPPAASCSTCRNARPAPFPRRLRAGAPRRFLGRPGWLSRLSVRLRLRP